MTLTSPNCPAAAELPLEVETKMRSIPGVVNARVEITFDPPWEPSRMTEAARLQLGML
jgi:metal-sulfur cluster biosynthetic enzyme